MLACSDVTVPPQLSDPRAALRQDVSLAVFEPLVILTRGSWADWSTMAEVAPPNSFG